MAIQPLQELAKQVLSDLDPSRSGLPWLSDDIATRVLLGDYLVGALSTAVHAFREARHGHDNLVVALRNFEVRTLVHLQATEDRELLPPPSNESEREHVARDSAITEFFRAVGSLMDSLGVAVAIIGAFDVDTVDRFTWPSFEKHLRDGLSQQLLAPVQANLADRTLDALRRAGPTDWLAWTLAMRNMLVHRPRRLWLVQLETERLGGQITRVSARILLPSEPAATDIEVMRWGGELGGAVINEPADELMLHTLRCLEGATREICVALQDLYRRRAADPALLTQPLQQWRGRTEGLPPRSGATFSGYSPRPDLDADALMTGPDMSARLAAGAVMDGRRSHWLDWIAITTGKKKLAADMRAAEAQRAKRDRRAAKRSSRNR